MARLKIQDFAKERDLNMSQLHGLVNKRLDKPIAMGTMRRYWYSSKDGKENGPAIEMVDLGLLGIVAQILQVQLVDLLNNDEEL